jgi:hypothetical protein
MIPFYLNAPGHADPAEPIYYLVAANGIFLVNKTPLFTSITEAGALPGLLRQEPTVLLSIPKVPRKIMERIYGFFREVYQRWEGEAVAFLYYAPAIQAFGIAVPPQTLYRYQSRGRWRTEHRVAYGSVPRVQGYVKLGDAHSHADLPAFFSHTDDRDDRQDGLRIILGDLDRPRPDVKVSFVAQGTRFILRPEDALEDFSTPLTPPRAWLNKVTCQTGNASPLRDGAHALVPPSPSRGGRGCG